MEEKIENVSENVNVQDNIIKDGIDASEPSANIYGGIEDAATEKEVAQIEEGKDSLEESPTEGETNEGTPEKEKTAIYERGDWKRRVETFLRKYPVAAEFVPMIGEQIVGDVELGYDDNCLEKALARVFDKVYVPPEKLAADADFLEKYIYTSEMVRNTVVERYLEDLEKSRPPKSISSGGITMLAPPDRPKSIAEAGAVIKSMLKNRRI